jgi:hypothetical protein
MLRIARFGGLLTYASSYAVPPGGAVKQVNITCALPGQLTSRGGLAPVSLDGTKGLPTGVVAQLFPAPGGVGKGDKLVMIDETGKITVTQATTDGGVGGGEFLVFVFSPADQSVTEGDAVVFAAEAVITSAVPRESPLPIDYKWQVSSDGSAWTDIGSGMTLSFTASIDDDGKRYRCVAVTATLGPAYSLTATLAVEPA